MLLKWSAVCVMFSVVPALAGELDVLDEARLGFPVAEMNHRYLGGVANRALDRRDAAYEELKTADQLRVYQQRLRHFFVTQLGGFPERTPLHARTVDEQTHDDFRLEKVIYESQPGHLVTAVLYLPLGRGPFPGVLVPCGHSADGKAAEAYQRASILLAKNGLAALCYDPIGQGERSQVLAPDGAPLYRSTLEHTLVGVGSILLGRSTARYRIWDGMCGIDYLQSRGDIDGDRIGCTGNSGGGTLTSYLMALDERIACAAPSCYLTGFRHLLATRGPQDAEQNIFAQVAFGMDHGDYVMMRAPRPTLMCVATRDFFDVDGAWYSFRQAKRFYTRMDFAERVDLIETDDVHGFSTQLRVGMVRWMRRWLLDKHDAIVEPDFPVFTPEELRCTPRGQVMLIDGARSVFDINADYEQKLRRRREDLWRSGNLEQARNAVRRVAGIRRVAELPQPAVDRVGGIDRNGYRIERIVIRPEPGIWLPGLLFVPAAIGDEAYLIADARGKSAVAEDGRAERLVRQGHLVLAIDVRGAGETSPAASGRDDWDAIVGPAWKDYFLAYLVGKSLVGMRAEDLLVSARVLGEYRRPGPPRDVHLVATGKLGPPALHAAALRPQQFASLRLEGSLASWSSVVGTPQSRHQLINAVHGALAYYDLPDLAGLLPEGKVTIEDVRGPDGKPLGESQE